MNTTQRSSVTNTEYQQESLSYYRYTPLLVKDPIVRLPIQGWQQALLKSLSLAMTDKKNPDIAAELNQLALLETYQGNYQAALMLCQLQIRYWQNVASHSGKHYLSYCIQPWVNTFRLQRWQPDKKGALCSYQQLAPERRLSLNSLNTDYGIELSLGELVSLDPVGGWHRKLETVYWCEFSQLLSSESDTSNFIRHIQDGLKSTVRDSIKVRLLEFWFKVLIEQREFSYALSALHRMKLTSGPYELPFQLLEMVLLLNLQLTETDAQASHFCDKLMVKQSHYTDVRNLYFVAAASGIFRQLDAPELKLKLCQHVLQLALQLKDEVLAVEARLELVKANQLDIAQLMNWHADSRYLNVRRQLGLADLNLAAHSESLIDCVTAISDLEFDKAAYLISSLIKT